MKISASDPDIETLVGRIRRKELNLRPDFQRGEVWSEVKRQKLIDTVLRGWQVPPIHVVSLVATSELEVLDGQQRLAAIRDFAAGDLRIDGNIEPVSAEIQALNGLSYPALSPNWRRKFNQYPIRVFTITEYQPDEPFELFYRLNQPTTLTSAEQRNAFFGPAREQVKQLVGLAEQVGLRKESIGFSNGRMAYDDVLARACMFQQAKSFHTRTTAGALNDKYRSNQAFDSTAISSVEDALRLLALAQSTYGRPLRLNKATLLSWLLFATENAAIGRNGHLFARYIAYFDRLQIEAKRQAAGGTLLKKQWLRFYQDRASSRVNDTLSVAGRDFVLWLFFADSRIPPEKITSKLDVAAQVLDRLERDVSDRDYLDPQGFVEALLDQRVWDLANARS